MSSDKEGLVQLWNMQLSAVIICSYSIVTRDHPRYKVE